MLQGSSRVSVVEKSPCDTALVFPLFLIHDRILLTGREVVERQTESCSQKLCLTLLGLILRTIYEQKQRKSRAVSAAEG